MQADPILVALSVASVLERIGIPYVIGGSVASTLHGEPRATLDVDFAIRLEPEQADALVDELEAEFYVDRGSTREAALERRHFNAIHCGSMVKVDFYVRPPEGLYAQELQRARSVRLADGPAGCARVATPEDTLLQKLRWYRLGDEVSDRHWRDVVGILKAQAKTLDREYLERWAGELELEDLLTRAWDELGSDA